MQPGRPAFGKGGAAKFKPASPLGMSVLQASAIFISSPATVNSVILVAISNSD